MKAFTFIIRTHALCLFVMVLSTIAQEQPVQNKTITGNKIQPQQVMQSQKPKTMSNLTIPGENTYKSPAMVNKVTLSNDRKSSTQQMRPKQMGADLRPLLNNSSSNMKKNGSKDDCFDAWIFMDGYLEFCYNDYYSWYICAGSNFYLELGNYEYVQWTSTGDGYFYADWEPYTCYEPGWYDLSNGYVQLCLTAYATEPCQNAYTCIDISLIPEPYIYMNGFSEFCYDELNDPCIQFGEDVWIDAGNYSWLQWNTYGDGSFEFGSWGDFPCYYPGPGDLSNGECQIEVLAHGFWPCSNTAISFVEIMLGSPLVGYLIPEDHVCEGASYSVSDAYCNGCDYLTWTTTGDGTFQDNYILNTVYYPGINDIQNGFVDLNVQLNSFGCGINYLTMRLFIDPLPDVFAGLNATIYEDETFITVGATVDNFESILWTTSGDGTFNDTTLLQANYTPGVEDKNNGSAELCLHAVNNCGDIEDCIVLTIIGLDRQTISLNQGWAGISSHLDIRQPDIEQVMAAIEDKLIILTDFEGNFYQPNTKSLESWDFTKGYYIKMASEATLEIAGLYPMTSQLDLQEGWNLIPVLSNVPLAIEDMLYFHTDDVEIVTEVAGIKVFWPEKEIATLQELIPGKAYLIKAIVPFSLSELPTVITAPVTDITSFSAISGGEVTNQGSSPVTARGVVWSASPNPTIVQHDGITSDGGGTGTWVSEVTELLPVMTYYLRAYATNHVGTAYGEELSFTTFWQCGDPLFDPRDGKTYGSVQIGNQCWMKQNLNHGIMINGTNNQSNNSIFEKHCYNNNNSNCEIYGGLYEWQEAMNYTSTSDLIPSERQGICPTGWHLPSDGEWTILTDYLGGLNIAGGKMKEVGTSHWSPPNTGATNSSGFTALGGGTKLYNGAFVNFGLISICWTTTQEDFVYPYKVWDRRVFHNNTTVERGYDFKTAGFSVRCIKDNFVAQLAVTPPNRDVTADAGTITFSITSNTNWAVSETVSWLTVSPMSGTINGSITVNYNSNTTNVSRIGQITITTDDESQQVIVTITQAGQFPCGISFVDSRDGKVYSTIPIGTQCWMKENLNIGTRVNSSINQINNTTIEKYCYSDNDANCDIYGGLYQWDETMNYSTASGVQGICPSGWHLPDDTEWATLTTFLGGDSGGKMKETGTTHWNSPNTAATNSSGFTALPGGYRDLVGSFSGLGTIGSFWSSTQYSTSDAWILILFNDDVVSYMGNIDKTYGVSVRCLKDYVNK